MTLHESSPAKAGIHNHRRSLLQEASASSAKNGTSRGMGPGVRRDDSEVSPYGFKIDAPVVALLSRSMCALAASFSA